MSSSFIEKTIEGYTSTIEEVPLAISVNTIPLDIIYFEQKSIRRNISVIMWFPWFSVLQQVNFVGFFARVNAKYINHTMFKLLNRATLVYTNHKLYKHDKISVLLSTINCSNKRIHNWITEHLLVFKILTTIFLEIVKAHGITGSALKYYFEFWFDLAFHVYLLV